MENVAIKGRGGNDVQHKNWKGKILRIWITIIRHGGLGHEVQESWPYLSNATPWPYELSHVKNKFSLVGLTRRKGYDIIGVNIFLRKIMRFPHKKCQTGAPYTTLVRSTSAKKGSSTARKEFWRRVTVDSENFSYLWKISGYGSGSLS